MSDKVAVWRHPGVLLAMTIAVAGYSLVWFCFKPAVFSHAKADFSCFYRAGRMVAAGDGARVYDLKAEREYDLRLNTSFVDANGHPFSAPFVFAPFVLPLFALLSQLPYTQAEQLWFGLNVATLLALPFILRTSLGWGNAAVIVTLLAPLLFVPVTLALMQGQPSLLLLPLFAVAFAASRTNDPARAGCVLALATFKPQLALPMLLALMVLRKWRTLAACASACLALFGVSVVTVGWRTTLNYPQALMEFSRIRGIPGGEHLEYMPNARGFLFLLLDGRVSAAAGRSLVLAVSAALLVAMTLRLKGSREFSATSYSMVITVTLLISYHAYLHDFSLLLLPYCLLADCLARRRWTLLHAAVAAAMLACYVIPLAPTSMRTTAVQMFVVVFGFAVLLMIASARTPAPAWEHSVVRIATTVDDTGDERRVGKERCSTLA